MEKSNFTFNTSYRYLLSTVLLLFVGMTSINAQCSLGVNSSTQISLDENCEAEVTYEMILNDQTTTCPDGIFVVNVKTLDEVIIPTSPIVTSEYIDQQLIAEVVDMNSGNTGWGFINIEDKLAPTFLCIDMTVSCTDIESFEPTAIDACDPNPTVVLLSQTSDDLDNCDPDFIEVITRTYQATDASGNVSATCTQNIYVERLDLDLIEFPDDLTQANGEAIPCDAIVPLTDEGTPDPSYSGVPTIDGDDLFPTTDLSCNVVVTFNDVILPSIGGVQKIMREWIVNEWFCSTSNTISEIQIIEIVDAEGPVFANCPSNTTISTTAGTDCEAIVLLQLPSVADECGTVDRVDLTTTDVFETDFNGGLVSLPIGVNTVTYTAYDNNNNSTECTYTITVEDDTAPVVVCDQNTVVALTLDGTAFVNAYSFDDGSYDDCGDVTYSVKRMDNGTGCGNFNSAFGPTVSFCCADIGSEVMVILRVTDENGSFNECMVSVEVQDKLPPAIVCPASITVDCDTPFDPENLADAFGPGATASDNCNVTLTETSSINLNSCNEGVIIRTFTATDPNGSAQCSQVITFVNNEPFDEDDITFPPNLVIMECVDVNTLDPANTGVPTLNEDACDMVGFDYDDKVFTIVNGGDACFKILRTWEVLDWCNQDPNTGEFATFIGVQVIEVVNTMPPAFTGSYDDVSVCTFDDDCENGTITLGAQAEDACVAELIYTYSIDLYNDGDFDIISNNVVGTSIDASGTYPLGLHRIVYRAEDGCGNSDTQTQFFAIVNCKQPTPYCLNGLAIELMPQDTDGDGEEDFGMIDIWANDFDAGSFHACGFPVTVSFSADPLDTGRVYTCDDFGENTVEIWAHATLPNGEILSDFCTASLDIQANNGICDDIVTTNLVVVDGQVKTEMNEESELVNVNLDGSALNVMTDNFGSYSFPAMPTGGAYTIIPTKEDEATNGITTADIILIQKHILGLQLLSSPYKVIAADVSGDEKIAGNDIIAIRKLLLGYYEEFPNNNSWRFVDAAYTFVNPENPLTENFNETYEIGDLVDNMSVNFVSIKVGDVNNTAIVNAQSEDATTRTTDKLTITMDDTKFKAGELVTAKFATAELVNLYGAQFTVQFNNAKLAYNAVNSAAFEVVENTNLGMLQINEGILTVSISDARLSTLNAEDDLFTIDFIALEDGSLTNSIAINSEATLAEAYDANLDVMEIDLEFRNNDGNIAEATPFVVYQNVPNPFTQSTTVSFTLPTTSQVTITVYDVAGKRLYSTSNSYGQGMNSVILDVNSFDANGILYYQVETNEYSATRKMVVLK